MRSIVKVPDLILRQPCKPVITIDSYIRSLIQEMIDYVKYLNRNKISAYGLAASQLGEPVQLFVIQTPAVDLIAMNPVVTKRYGIHTWIESCLSIPGCFYSVVRPKLIKFHYISVMGEMRAGKFRDDYAGVVEHELQHTQGILTDTIGVPISREALFPG